MPRPPPSSLLTINGWCWSLGYLRRYGRRLRRFAIRILFVLMTDLVKLSLATIFTILLLGWRIWDLDLWPLVLVLALEARLHMFWACAILSTYWQDLFSFFDITLHLPVPYTPEVGLLGILNDIASRTYARILICLLLFYAHKLILLNWKNAAAPSIQHFYSLVNKDLPKFKLIYNCRACTKKFTKVWQHQLDSSDSFWGFPTGKNQCVNFTCVKCHELSL